MANYDFTGSIGAGLSVGGTQVLDRVSTHSPDERKRTLGYRASTPLLVHVIDVETPDQIMAGNIAANGHFLIGGSYAPASGDPLTRRGAKAGSVGTRIVRVTAESSGPGVNELLYSEEFEHASWLGNALVFENQQIAPDGETTADTLEEANASALEAKTKTVTIPDDSLTWLLSVFVLKTTGAKSFPGLSLALQGGVAQQGAVALNTDDGTITARSGWTPDDSGVDDYGDYWRVWIAVQNDSSGNVGAVVNFHPAVNTDGGVSWATATRGPAAMWGAMLEKSSTLSEYAKTEGAVNTQTVHYAFRDPLEKEAVWHIEITDTAAFVDHGFYRWDNEVWKLYKTWPQRALEGQYAFEVLDPDKIYDYYAKVVGGTMAQWAIDNKALFDLIDPDKCPIEFLPDLAGQFNLKLNPADEEVIRRERIRQAIPTFRQRGLELGVILRLRSAGYSGYAKEIWVNPGNPNNYTDDDTGEKGTDWIELYHGSKRDAPKIGLRFINDENPIDGETVEVDDYSTQVTFEFDDDASVSGGNTSVTIGATASETLTNFINAVNASALTVTAKETPMTDWAELQLDGGKLTSDAITVETLNNYWPSSRLSIHVSHLNGDPILMDQSVADIDDFKAFLALELGPDVLPVWATIRYFVTDLELGPTNAGEQLELSDTLTIWITLRWSASIEVTVTLGGGVGIHVVGHMSVPPTLGGSFDIIWVSLSISAPPTLGGTVDLDAVIAGGISVPPTLTGDFVYRPALMGAGTLRKLVDWSTPAWVVKQAGAFNRVAVAPDQSGAPTVLAGQTVGNVYYSDDHGETWTQQDEGFNFSVLTGWFSGGTTYFWGQASDSKGHFTTDKGDNWTDSSLNTSAISAVAVPGTTTVVPISAAGVVYRATNGITFALASTQPDLDQGGWLTIDPETGYIYAVGFHESGGGPVFELRIYRSTDDGDTFALWDTFAGYSTAPNVVGACYWQAGAADAGAECILIAIDDDDDSETKILKWVYSGSLTELWTAALIPAIDWISGIESHVTKGPAAVVRYDGKTWALVWTGSVWTLDELSALAQTSVIGIFEREGER